MYTSNSFSYVKNMVHFTILPGQGRSKNWNIFVVKNNFLKCYNNMTYINLVESYWPAVYKCDFSIRLCENKIQMGKIMFINTIAVFNVAPKGLNIC